MVWRFRQAEGSFANFIFTTALTGALYAALVVLTRRLLAPLIALTAFITVVYATSYAKYQATTFVLHAWDFIYYVGDWGEVATWWSGRPWALAIAIAGLASLVIGTWLAWRYEPATIARKVSLPACALLIGATFYTAQARGERPHMLFNFPDWHWSSFLISFDESFEAIRRGGLIAAAPQSAPRPFARSACTPSEKPPHVILIHEESVGPPSLFPQIKYDPTVDALFKSFDGKMHKMRVETFGGGSWLTESSVLLGLSSQFFGGMKHFIQYFTAGHLRDTLPLVMASCGYRTVMFYPAFKGFFGNAKFFETVGIEEIFDRKAQGAKSDWETDRFYFDNAVAEIGRHVAQSPKPLFIYLQTMSAHWPYDIAFQPDIEVPGGAPGTPPQINEYLRRLAMARLDYDHLKQDLARRFPNERFLIVQYGDHHAMPVAQLYGYKDEDDVKDMNFAPDSAAMTTYFGVDGINYTPPPLPDIDVVDVGYLGAILLEAARLPMPASWRERLRLMNVCGGRYYDCPKREDVLAFHRRLIDSGLLPKY
ncbi:MULTISPECIES: sulfatase-like hydrolase/transferase [unclassified Beijerinckia]|uniref:sulfatase-like hydrolase/transferase n=1 Tax=unclassified Beijerinckia TaxID=2638183 RepID=UPI00089A54DA|nr:MULTISPECIES: sulfatase-like hydrolase/transferase [unclassified Beijerinckia]MDH7799308.1 phosphoglycerol transferase MdoB-like AlkP superfamily enzyme [Beijerinckia sp. GAS462]SED45718.1 Sulfatase [Beijerinckia sp. 28-YEA-48]